MSWPVSMLVGFMAGFIAYPALVIAYEWYAYWRTPRWRR